MTNKTLQDQATAGDTTMGFERRADETRFAHHRRMSQQRTTVKGWDFSYDPSTDEAMVVSPEIGGSWVRPGGSLHRRLLHALAKALAERFELPVLDKLHDLLYTAQRFDGAVRDAAIAEARVIVHKLNAPQPWPKEVQPDGTTTVVDPDDRVVFQLHHLILTPAQIKAAAKKLAELTDYPWETMPEHGRIHMRQNAEAVIRAAFSE